MSIFKNLTKTCDCTRGYCHRPDAIHGACIGCGDVTSERRLVITPKLDRRVMPLCLGCYMSPSHSRQQDARAEKRTKQAWELVTDPVATQSIQPDRMPEQNAGPSRAAVRAFFLSTSTVAVVPELDAATLNNSIAVLGLSGEMYAETRGTETVLRKVS